MRVTHPNMKKCLVVFVCLLFFGFFLFVLYFLFFTRTEAKNPDVIDQVFMPETMVHFRCLVFQPSPLTYIMGVEEGVHHTQQCSGAARGFVLWVVPSGALETIRCQILNPSPLHARQTLCIISSVPYSIVGSVLIPMIGPLRANLFIKKLLGEELC